MIRRAREGDAQALHALAAVTFPLACPPGSTEADQRAFVDAHLSTAAFGGYLADPARVVLLDEDADGRAVGYTMLVVGPPADADVRAAVPGTDVAELSKCYALPDAHGTGVAGALVTATLAEAAARGAATVWLGVNEENARAQRFYAKHGFAVVGTKRFQVGSRLERDLVLARPLP
jgi:diamine N-acetyltransferase